MGTFYWPIEVGSMDGSTFETVDAMVDTGAFYTKLPASQLRRIGVVPNRRRRFRLGDGRIVERETGPAIVRVAGEETYTIVVFGEEDTSPLLGAYTLEGAALVVDPQGQLLAPADNLML